MKKLLLAFALLAFVGCSKEVIPENVTFTIGYNIESATRADQYSTFYNDYVKTKLVGHPNYCLEFYKGDELIASYKGTWEAATVTLPEGAYKVTGYSGLYREDIIYHQDQENLQHNKMTLVFDEEITVSKGVSNVVLSPTYDCYLLLFDTATFSSASLVGPREGWEKESCDCSFTKAGNVLYAFVNSKSKVHSIKFATNDGDSGTLNISAFGFENGKYYSLDAVATGYNAPPMENGF